MGQIREYLETRPLSGNIKLESVTIYETAQEPATSSFSELAKQYLSSDGSNNEHNIFVHFGVHTGAKTFLLEQQAWNEMNFRVPDQRGFQPNQLPICSADGSTTFSRNCLLPLTEINATLGSQFAFNGEPIVGLSTDPGRFLCNYLYYISLCETSKYPNCHSLFVHVPSFDTIPKTNQLEFIHALLNELCSSACK